MGRLTRRLRSSLALLYTASPLSVGSVGVSVGVGFDVAALKGPLQGEASCRDHAEEGRDGGKRVRAYREEVQGGEVHEAEDTTRHGGTVGQRRRHASARVAPVAAAAANGVKRHERERCDDDIEGRGEGCASRRRRRDGGVGRQRVVLQFRVKG